MKQGLEGMALDQGKCVPRSVQTYPCGKAERRAGEGKREKRWERITEVKEEGRDV